MVATYKIQMELVTEKIAGAGAITTLDATERIGSKVTVAGVRRTSHRSHTAKGEPMLFLTLEDLNGTLDVILFPDVYRATKSFVNSNKPLLIYRNHGNGFWRQRALFAGGEGRICGAINHRQVTPQFDGRQVFPDYRTLHLPVRYFHTPGTFVPSL